MEKARLTVVISKNGTPVVNALFTESGKKMPIQRLDYPDVLSLNGKEVEIEKAGGQITKITYNGKVIFSKSQAFSGVPAREPAKQHLRMPNAGTSEKAVQKIEHAKDIKNPARAPYNFIPLNETVIPSPSKPGEGDCVFDRYHEGRYTGHIELVIKTETPLYIRDTLTEREIQEKEEIEKDGKKKYINSDFFSPADKIRIPGSSLRGMIRTMVEMVSFGKFGFFDDKRLYFRAVADRSKLGSDYKSTMVDESNNHFPKIKAGILKKDGQTFIIYPSKNLPTGSNGTQIYRVNFNKNTKVVDGTTNFKVPNFEFRDVYFQPVTPQDHPHQRWDDNKGAYVPYKLKYAKLISVSETKNHQYPQKGFIIASGEFGNKKHRHWVINEPEDKFIPIEDHVIKEYKGDSSRDERADLLKKLETHSGGVPCFYIIDTKGKVISFGHTGMFRLAYTKTIGDHILIPTQSKEESTMDIAETIFGNEKTFAGRVFFEDALLSMGQEDVLEENIPHILSNPKPTTFQHYLVQTTDNLENHPRKLANYNSPNPIQGNKLYWHKTSENWQETKISFTRDKFEELLKKNNLNVQSFGDALQPKDQNKEVDLTKLPDNLKPIILKAIGIYETQHTKIKPVNKDKIFIGKIRFENLSDVELGALLFALALPENCCHKLGMGKPLGLGSVHIIPKLFLSDRKTRYEKLFAEWEQPVPESTTEGKDIPDFKKIFAEYILKGIGEDSRHDSVNTLWEVDRMKELKTMLDFKKRPDDKKTRYMQIEPKNEFKERKVLPLPTEVVQ